MACDTNPPSVAAIGTDIDVIEKYKLLMEASTKEGSVYALSKSTIFEISKQLQVDEKARGAIVIKQVTDLTLGTSAANSSTYTVKLYPDLSDGQGAMTVSGDLTIVQFRK